MFGSYTPKSNSSYDTACAPLNTIEDLHFFHIINNYSVFLNRSAEETSIFSMKHKKRKALLFFNYWKELFRHNGTCMFHSTENSCFASHTVTNCIKSRLREVGCRPSDVYFYFFFRSMPSKSVM